MSSNVTDVIYIKVGTDVFDVPQHCVPELSADIMNGKVVSRGKAAVPAIFWLENREAAVLYTRNADEATQIMHEQLLPSGWLQESCVIGGVLLCKTTLDFVWGGRRHV